MEFLLQRCDQSGGPDACWPWLRRRTSAGYGALTVKLRRAYAHRLMLEFKIGRKLGKKEQAIHACDNPPCINPSHLSVGTALLNMQDCVAKKRHHQSKKTHCPKGHPYDEVNARYNTRTGKNPFRSCAICNAQRGRNRRDKTRVLKYVAKPKIARIYAELARKRAVAAELKELRERVKAL